VLTVGSWQSAVEVMKEIEKDEVFYRESGGGVTFSGGEPLMQADALKELLSFCKGKGYHTVIDTSGHAEPAAVRKVMPLADLWLFDLKILDDIKHVEFTGVSNELAIKNLEMLARNNSQIIIRFPLIPGITDGPGNMEAISRLMKQLRLTRIDVLPYHNIAADKYRRMKMDFLMEGVMEPGKERVKEIKEIFEQQGFLVGIG
jgi:pyruvate formate lyase activating enzyme